MDIRANALAQNYHHAKTIVAPSPQDANLENSLEKIATDFANTLMQGEQTARAALTGGADPHALVQALASSQLAVETVATVRDKVVEAYQEILRMPV